MRIDVIARENRAGGRPTGRVERFAADMPMGRAGELHEPAQAASFLVSGESSYVTGSELRVAGGQTDI